MREQVKSLNCMGEESIKPFQDIVFSFSVLEVCIEYLTKNTGVILLFSISGNKLLVHTSLPLVVLQTCYFAHCCSEIAFSGV